MGSSSVPKGINCASIRWRRGVARSAASISAKSSLGDRRLRELRRHEQAADQALVIFEHVESVT